MTVSETITDHPGFEPGTLTLLVHTLQTELMSQIIQFRIDFKTYFYAPWILEGQG